MLHLYPYGEANLLSVLIIAQFIRLLLAGTRELDSTWATLTVIAHMELQVPC